MSTSESVATATEDVAADPRHAPGPQRAQSAYATSFAGFLLLGVVLIGLLSAAAWWVPGATALGLYAAMGIRRAQDQGLVIEFTDSIYYMGFILTLTALLKTTGVFGGVLPDSQTMVVEFGKGLFTTVLGVFLRVLFQLYYLIPQESLEQSTKAIQALSLQYIQTLRAANEAVDENWTGAVESVTEAVKKLDTSLAEVNRHTKSLSDALNSSGTDIGMALKQVRDSIAGAEVATRMASLTDELQKMGESVRVECSTASQAFSNAATSVSSLGRSSATLGAEVNDLKTKVRGLETVLDQIVEAIEVRLKKIGP
ncbi:MAG: hypothetical protein ABW171_12030 [Steroidobacter sp.]